MCVRLGPMLADAPLRRPPQAAAVLWDLVRTPPVAPGEEASVPSTGMTGGGHRMRSSAAVRDDQHEDDDSSAGRQLGLGRGAPPQRTAPRET